MSDVPKNVTNFVSDHAVTLIIVGVIAFLVYKHVQNGKTATTPDKE